MTVKRHKKGTFLPTMKGSNGTKMRVNTHEPEVKPAKSSFGMVRNPSRVERGRKKNFEKNALYRPTAEEGGG